MDIERNEGSHWNAKAWKLSTPFTHLLVRLTNLCDYLCKMSTKLDVFANMEITTRNDACVHESRDGERTNLRAQCPHRCSHRPYVAGSSADTDEFFCHGMRQSSSQKKLDKNEVNFLDLKALYTYFMFGSLSTKFKLIYSRCMHCLWRCVAYEWLSPQFLVQVGTRNLSGNNCKCLVA